MLEKLIIWITHAAAASDDSQARWLVLDAKGNRVGFPQQGSLAECADATAQRRVIVMLPGERILSASARVPGNNPRRILQAAPYALEDRLAGDVDELHVALLARHADQECDFVVVERAWFGEVLQQLETSGVHPHAVWPEYLGVPEAPDATHWVITANNRLLSRNGWQGFTAPATDIAFLYSHRGEDQPLQMSLVGDQPPPAAMGELETSRYADTERVFTEMAATVSALPGTGLLQGAFRRQREGAPDWQRWKWPGVAAVALLLLLVADFGIETWQLQRENALLENATRELFQRALPGNQRMVDPRFQIEQALGATNAGQNRLLKYLGQVGAALQEVPDARLNGFNYRSNYFEFSVTVPNATALERVRTALAERAGSPVDVQSANSTPNGLEGRLLLSAGGTQ